MEQQEYYAKMGITGENDDPKAIEDYDDYVDGGGTMSFEEWQALQAEADESDYRFWEEMAEIAEEVHREGKEIRPAEIAAEIKSERAEFYRDMMREDGINVNREE